MPQERSAITRQQILDAAVICFAQQGYARASTAAIANAAGVSQGTVFHHFATKEGLFAAIVREAVDGFTRCVAEAAQRRLTPPRQIELVLRLVAELTLAHPHRTDIIIRRFFSMPLDPATVDDYGLTEVVSALREALEQGRKSGAFGEVDTQTAALSLLGIYLANYVGWAALGKGYDFVQALERDCRTFLDGLVAQGARARRARK